MVLDLLMGLGLQGIVGYWVRNFFIYARKLSDMPTKLWSELIEDYRKWRMLYEKMARIGE